MKHTHESPCTRPCVRMRVIEILARVIERLAGACRCGTSGSGHQKRIRLIVGPVEEQKGL